MVSSIFKFVKLAREVLRGGASPASIAAGVTAGMLAGLIPSDSLLVPMIAIVVMATQINLFVAAISMIAFTWIGSYCDSLLHQTGALVLTHPKLQSTLTWAAEAPILPWTRFNNTIVCGAVVLGTGLAYPVYFFTHQLVERLAPKLHRLLVAYRIFRLIAGIPNPELAPAIAGELPSSTAAPDLGAST